MTIRALSLIAVVARSYVAHADRNSRVCEFGIRLLSLCVVRYVADHLLL